MAKKTFHNIICPGCFSEFKPNNVVLALSKGPKYHDKYTRAQITNNATRVIREYFDPVLFNGTKIYSEDGVLMKLENTEQDICADVRLCPYCHYELPLAFIGNKKTYVVSVLGCPGAGKSVYERALIYALRKNGFTMSVKNDNREIDIFNPEYYKAPNQKNDEKNSWAATTEIRGPYIYNVQSAEDDFLLVLYDLPGEYFNKTSEITDNYVSSILGRSDLAVFIIDPTNFEKSRISLETYINLLETNFSALKNLAILVNKVDEIYDTKTFNAFDGVTKKHKNPGSDSEHIKNLIEERFFKLPKNLPRNTKFFTSRLFERNGNNWEWNPVCHEEPFLWWLQTIKSADKKGEK